MSEPKLRSLLWTSDRHPAQTSTKPRRSNCPLTCDDLRNGSYLRLMKNRACLLLLVFMLSCDDGNEVSLPATPYNLKAIRMTETSAVISWSDSTSVGGNYRILRAVNTSAYEQLTTVPQGTLSYTDSAIEPEATYSYQMTLVDANGNSSEYSEVATV